MKGIDFLFVLIAIAAGGVFFYYGIRGVRYVLKTPYFGNASGMWKNNRFVKSITVVAFVIIASVSSYYVFVPSAIDLVQYPVKGTMKGEGCLLAYTRGARFYNHQATIRLQNNEVVKLNLTEDLSKHSDITNKVVVFEYLEHSKRGAIIEIHNKVCE